MNEVAVASLLDALSLSRSRRFCLMVEDECANLVRRHRLSRGLVRRLEFPPLAESLRDLISATAARFGLRSRTLPEGDQEKAMELTCPDSACRAPVLGYRDLIPSRCPLEALSQDERQRLQLRPLDRSARPLEADGGGTQVRSGLGTARGAEAPLSADTAAPGGVGAGGGPDSAARRQAEAGGSEQPGSADEAGKPAKRARRPAMAVYRPRGVREERDSLSSHAAATASVAKREPTADASSGSSAPDPASAARGKDRDSCQGGDGMVVDQVGVAEVPASAEDSQRGSEGGWSGLGQMLGAFASSEECSVLYQYESFQIDPTPRAWDQPRKRAFVDLVAGGRWQRDATWQLKANDNGFFSFTAQVCNGPSLQACALSTKENLVYTCYVGASV